MNKNDIIELTNKLYRLTLLFPKKEPLRYKIREIADDILADSIILEVFQSSNPNRFANLSYTFSRQKLQDLEKSKRKEVIFTFTRDLEVLNSYFEIAKWQNWVSFFDILEIEEEYDKIKEEIAELSKNEINSLFLEEKQDFNKKIDSETEEKENSLVQAPLEVNELEEKPINDKPIIGQINQITNQTEEILDSRKVKILEILKEKGKMQVGEVSGIFSEVSKRTIRRDFVQLLEQGLIERIGEKNDTFYQLRDKDLKI